MELKQNAAATQLEELHLNALKEGTPGITQAFGEGLAQAASVCLEDQRHSSGDQMNVDGDFNRVYAMSWDTTTEQMRQCWADPEVATEHGAYGIASLLVPRLTDLTVIQRSRKGTGFDFWLGPEGDPAPLFQKKARLEVSGIRNGTKAIIQSRVRQKLEQIGRSDGPLPALVIVVEFGEPRSRVIKKCET